jgi:hypothetical protein
MAIDEALRRHLDACGRALLTKHLVASTRAGALGSPRLVLILGALIAFAVAVTVYITNSR